MSFGTYGRQGGTQVPLSKVGTMPISKLAPLPPRMAPKPMPTPPRMALPTPPRMPPRMQPPVMPPRMQPPVTQPPVMPPRMQPPVTQPPVMPPRMQPPVTQPPVMPAPMPMPELPYGGPITMPGGPYTPRPDLGPNIGFGVGLPQPGMPTPGMGDGKSAPMPGMPTPPGFQTTYQQLGYNSLDEALAAMDPNMGQAQKVIYDGQPSPMPPNMYSQPNFANALGTQSPFLNSVQR